MAATTAAVAGRWCRRGLFVSGRCLLASSDAAVDNRVSTPTLLWRSLRLLSTTPHSLRNAGPTPLPLGASVVEEVTVEGNRYVFETGKLAKLADGCALFKTGDTHAMVTSVASRKLEEGKDFMPLQVEYRERMGAIGRIPSTFNRREGSPKDREILMMRAIDRAIRPLFPKGFFYETQVLASILSAEESRETDVACINAASMALTLSDIPWNGPVGAMRLAVLDGEMVLDPSIDQIAEAEFNLLYACTADRSLMIEASGMSGGVSDVVFAAAIQKAHAAAVQLIPPQVRLAAKMGKPKRDVPLVQPSDQMMARVQAALAPLTQAVVDDTTMGKNQREGALGAARDQAMEEVSAAMAAEGEAPAVAALLFALDVVEGGVIRKGIKSGTRCDGRGLNDVRPLFAEAGLLPIVHGSSLFNRGDTQALATVTVGSLDDRQKLDSLVGPRTKRLMLHYAFPPYSVNECGKVGGASRREIGHGALAEKALAGVLPPEAIFPFSVRINSDTMGSNGSSSMAAVCSGSLALMDAGVPLLDHAAGVSVGLIMDEDHDGRVTAHTIFTDIQGMEDHHGDMDFKIAGTRDGITAVQLDIKPAGVPLEILLEALSHATKARHTILDTLVLALEGPRVDVRDNAPRFGSVTVEKELLGRVIGPQGSHVKGIERDTAARITINDTGEVNIFAPTKASFEAATQRIMDAGVPAVRVGSRYLGKVVSIKDFGAIVELAANATLGLLHISEIAHHRTVAVTDELQLGQELEVQCIGLDPRGNVKFSRKALLPLPPPRTNNATNTRQQHSPPGYPTRNNIVPPAAPSPPGRGGQQGGGTSRQ